MTDTTATTATADTTLASFVLHNPVAAQVFERHRLDYCCDGQRTLADACREAGLDPDDVRRELTASAPRRRSAISAVDPVSLTRQIVATHHRYLHDELPRLDALASKVLGVHGVRHPELGEVRRLVAELRSDLEPHLRKEELVLFPAIEALASEGRREFPFGSIGNPVRMMQLEHDRAGALLAELRRATNDYTAPPDDACSSYRSLFERLAALEADTHQHVHLENNVLFPAVLELAAATRAGAHPGTAQPAR